jgi:hypothetical protein
MAKIFALEAIRTMTKGAAGMSIGSDAFLLSCVIVTQQDSIQYRRPVSNWNHTLCDILGFNQKQLFRARDRAIEAGWLQYTPGRKSVAGNYMVTIPEHAKDCDGTICEEITEEAGNNKGTMCPQSGNNVSIMREQCGNNAGTIRETFIPNPIPKPIPGENARDTDNAAEAEGVDDFVKSMSEPLPQTFNQTSVDDPDDWMNAKYHPLWKIISRSNLKVTKNNWQAWITVFEKYPNELIIEAKTHTDAVKWWPAEIEGTCLKILEGERIRAICPRYESEAQALAWLQVGDPEILSIKPDPEYPAKWAKGRNRDIREYLNG